MTQYRRAHSQRIIGAVIYDWLICIGLLMIGGFIAVGLNKLITDHDEIHGNILFQLYLCAIIFGYFFYFWMTSGQTVGMKAWRIKLINIQEEPITVKQMLLRVLASIPAYGLALLGVFWQYISSRKLNWHDIVSKTRLVYIPKPPKVN